MEQKVRSDQQDDDVNLREIIDIRDSALDVDEIIERVRSNLHGRRCRPEDNDWEAIPSGQDVSHHLQKLSLSYNQIGTDIILTNVRIPLIGPLWQKFRRSLHCLVLFYLAIVTKNQVRFNGYTVQALIALIKYLGQENKRTKAELKMLQERVARLEAAAKITSLDQESVARLQ
jgi:hypothetical protein